MIEIDTEKEEEQDSNLFLSAHTAFLPFLATQLNTLSLVGPIMKQVHHLSKSRPSGSKSQQCQ